MLSSKKKADFSVGPFFHHFQGMEDLSTWHRPNPGAEIRFGWLRKSVDGFDERSCAEIPLGSMGLVYLPT